MVGKGVLDGAGVLLGSGVLVSKIETVLVAANGCWVDPLALSVRRASTVRAAIVWAWPGTSASFVFLGKVHAANSKLITEKTNMFPSIRFITLSFMSLRLCFSVKLNIYHNLTENQPPKALFPMAFSKSRNSLVEAYDLQMISA
jgi:hypothetical protein